MATERTSVEICKIESIGHFDSKHSRHAIYSADIQHIPIGNRGSNQPLRLATAGGDGSVKIWNISKVEVDLQDLLLASLDHHTKSVNIVRWSSDGTLLASGSDDTYIIVYRLLKLGVNNSTFGNNRKNKESWQRYYTMRGHTMDVLDISWSPRDIVASGSIDNKIMVWVEIDKNSPGAVMRTPFKVLSGHKSFVKGVSFDPTGRYLASCCSNNIVIIWDSSEWLQVASLPGPMNQSPDRAIYRRMSWAPDGNSLCLSSASKSEKPVGMVLKRGSWESVADLVGHDAQSCCSRFLSHVLTTGSSSRGNTVCTVALGDQAGIVSFWSTDKKTPYLVLRDTFEGSVTDISWTVSSGGRLAAMSSLDGSIAFVTLSGDTLQPMTGEQLDNHFLKLYGESMDAMWRAPEALIENPEALRYLLQSTSSTGEGAVKAAEATQSMPAAAAVPRSLIISSDKSVLELQEVSVTKTGKKRIRPVVDFVSYETEDTPRQSEPVIQSSTSVLLPAETSGSILLDGKNTDAVEAVVAPVSELSIASPLAARASGLNGVSTNGFKAGATNSQNVTAAPLMVNTNRGSSRGGQDVPSSSSSSACQGGLLQVSFESDKAVHSLTRLAVDQAKTLVVNGSEVKHGMGMNGGRASSLLVAKLVAPPSLLLSQRSQSSLITIVSLMDGRSTESWTNAIVGEVTTLGCCSNVTEDIESGIAVVGCFDGSLHILSLRSGTRLMAPLLLGLVVAHVDLVVLAGSIRLLAATIDGDLWTWQLENDTILCDLRTTVKPLMQTMKCRPQEEQKSKRSKLGPSTLESCYFDTSGKVIASVHSKGATGGDLQMFSYCPKIMVWTRIADIRHVLSSSFISSALSSSRSASTHLDMLQEDAIKGGGLSTGEVLSISRSRILAPSAELKKYEGYITLAHLEEKLSTSFIMESLVDAKYWIKEWVTLCAQSKVFEGRLRSLVNNLLRPNERIEEDKNLKVSNDASAMLKFVIGSRGESVLGLSKELWLKDVIIPALVQSGGGGSLFSELNEVINFQSRNPK